MKELTVILFCTWKFALTFPLAIYSLNLSFTETLLYTNIGGLLGLIVFSFLSAQIIHFWRKHIQARFKKQHKPINRRTRRFIKIKNKYGFTGLVILNPIIISIPISSFLVIKYFGLNIRNLVWLFIGQLSWSLIYTVFYFYIKPLTT